MRRLIITGNGFDRAHRLPTSYEHFRKYLKEYRKPFYRAIQRYLPNEELWCDFEAALGELDDWKLQEDNSSYYLDYGADNWRDSAHYEFQFMIEQDLSFAADIPFYFKEWICRINTDVPAIVSRDIFNKHCKFLNFNFTDTLERVYGIPSPNILYIHGKALGNDNLIIGHHATETFQCGGVSAFNAAEEHGIYMESEDEDIRITEAKEVIKAYFKNTFKDTASIINNKYAFFNSLADIEEVFILGHSLSDIDMDYFFEIRKQVMPCCRWYISYFTQDDLDAIEHFVSRLNIENYQLVKIPNL